MQERQKKNKLKLSWLGRKTKTGRISKFKLPEEILFQNAGDTKETVHTRYKDLTHVEMAFRTSKTVELEMRPINVRLASRTRGHVFVVMLAYKIVQELSKRWREIDITVEEGIKELTTLCAIEIEMNECGNTNQIPKPRESIKKLLKAAKVSLPATLPSRGIIVSTKKKLTNSR